MRKLLALAAIILLCFSLFSAKSSMGNDSVIQNGGFENGLEGWTTMGQGVITVTDENMHGGNYSLETSSMMGQLAFLYQYVNCPNDSYTFSFWIYRADPDSWTAIYLDRDWNRNTAYVASGLVIEGDKIYAYAWNNRGIPGKVFDYAVTAGDWHNVTFVAEGVSKTQNFYIDGNLIESLASSSGGVWSPDLVLFGDVSTDSCNGTFYFDDFQLDFQGPPDDFAFSVESNSTVTGMEFNAQNATLSFTVSGEEGTTGYVRMTLAKNLAPDIEKLKIQVDSLNCDYTYEETSTSWIITFSYSHSTHQVCINLGQTSVDEYPPIAPIAFSLLFISAGMLLTLLRKKRVQTTQRSRQLY